MPKEKKFYAVFGAAHEAGKYIRSYKTHDKTHGKDAKKMAEEFAKKMTKPDNFKGKWQPRKVVELDEAKQKQYHNEKRAMFKNNEKEKENIAKKSKYGLEAWRKKNIFA